MPSQALVIFVLWFQKFGWPMAGAEPTINEFALDFNPLEMFVCCCYTGVHLRSALFYI
jgi:hypothetical protein